MSTEEEDGPPGGTNLEELMKAKTVRAPTMVPKPAMEEDTIPPEARQEGTFAVIEPKDTPPVVRRARLDKLPGMLAKKPERERPPTFDPGTSSNNDPDGILDLERFWADD